MKLSRIVTQCFISQPLIGQDRIFGSSQDFLMRTSDLLWNSTAFEEFQPSSKTLSTIFNIYRNPLLPKFEKSGSPLHLHVLIRKAAAVFQNVTTKSAQTKVIPSPPYLGPWGPALWYRPPDQNFISSADRASVLPFNSQRHGRKTKRDTSGIHPINVFNTTVPSFSSFPLDDTRPPGLLGPPLSPHCFVFPSRPNGPLDNLEFVLLPPPCCVFASPEKWWWFRFPHWFLSVSWSFCRCSARKD